MSASGRGGWGPASRRARRAIGGHCLSAGAHVIEDERLETFAAKLGYRYISVDYDKDGFVYDMANSGLYLGLGIRF